jgi:division protein CdvB (Snf7/Vps24/ESCRT-III family)
MKFQMSKKIVVLILAIFYGFTTVAFSLDEIKGQITAADAQLKAASTQMGSGKTLLNNQVASQLSSGLAEINKTLNQINSVKSQIGSIKSTIESIPDAGVRLRSIIFGIVNLGDLDTVIRLMYNVLDDMVNYLEHMKSNFTKAIDYINNPHFQDIDPRPGQNATSEPKNIATKFDIAQFNLKKATDMLDSILDRMNKQAADLD